MEESGENWPSDSDVEMGDELSDFSSDGEEFLEPELPVSDSFGETVDLKMDDAADRKGTQKELAEILVALSATIPGFKKMDNSCILDKASNYVKQLEERVRELEKQVQSYPCNNEGTTSCEVNSSDCYGPNDHILHLPEVKARVLQKQVLVVIHCEKQKGIMLKILSHLENLHLSVVNSSLLPFGKSILDITIVAQMGDEYNMTVNELVKSLRLVLTQ